MTQYSKPAFSTAQHLQQWQQRGLHIPDMARAERYLANISYYRLSAYAIPFYQPPASAHQFRANATFDDILTLYIFDRELRLLVMDAIERIEVAVRAHMSNHMATTYGNDPFWYQSDSHFKRDYQHKRFLADIERQLSEERQRLENDERHVDKRNSLSAAEKAAIKAKLRKENFLRHYLCTYDSPRLPPCWMVMEMLTWGSLSRFYAGLSRQADQKAIARLMGTNAELLESWLKSLNTIRNFCAHHARLWNRELGVSVKLPNSSQVRWLQQPVTLADPHIRYEKRLYPVFVALQCMLYTISPSSHWAQRLRNLMQSYPNTSLANMGVPVNWTTDPFWQDAFNA
jgi:abortive infection bacteriophage resistance protein